MDSGPDSLTMLTLIFGGARSDKSKPAQRLAAPAGQDPVTRAFRNVRALLSQWAAQAAEEVIFMVAGLPLYLETASRRQGSH
jgi:adenosyl cobinamide kinase/adenosyl cobinamide phosphate guanylyltransferase